MEINISLSTPAFFLRSSEFVNFTKGLKMKGKTTSYTFISKEITYSIIVPSLTYIISLPRGDTPEAKPMHK